MRKSDFAYSAFPPPGRWMERRGERTVGELSHMMADKQVEPVELFAPATTAIPIGILAGYPIGCRSKLLHRRTPFRGLGV